MGCDKCSFSTEIPTTIENYIARKETSNIEK